ncbi:MAG: STAS domain-containing protein [Actinomycetota bacterium]|nr:STAS domain-containing protein [Actinomycetota bacterium]
MAEEPPELTEAFGIVSVRKDDDTVAVSPRGELDVSTSPRLVACIENLLAEGRSRIILDLDSVTFIDSSGLGALVKAHKRAVQLSAEVTVIKPRPHVHRAMEISGILRVIRVEGTD